MELFGRTKIYTGETAITKDNILDVLGKALPIHSKNVEEIDFLYWYCRGQMPILQRRKEVRPEICHKIVTNHPLQIKTFKNGYFLTKPAFYVSRVEDEETTEKVRLLNEYLYSSGKAHADNEVVDWFHTCGVGALYIGPDKKGRKRKPVTVHALDPRSAFCVYSLRPGNEPMLGVNIVVNGNETFIDAISADYVYRIKGSGESRTAVNAIKIESIERNELGCIPIIEYQADGARMACFENAISLIDAYNSVESSRVDSVEQAVQQLCVAVNCTFEEGTTANKIRQAGMICLKSTNESKADFKILSEELDQTATQNTLDSLYEQILYKCSVPATNKGTASTSDTGTAVYLRDGFAAADTAARNTRDYFIASNQYFDECFLKILRDKVGLEIEPEDFELKIEQNSTSNLLAKAQAALCMKELGLAPEIVLERSGLSNDPLTDIAKSVQYIEAAWNQPKEAVVEDDGLSERI